MEKIFKWLFGENERLQEKKLKKLLQWTLGMFAGMIIFIFISPACAEAIIAVILLMWGWSVAMAILKINKIVDVFSFNFIVIAFILVFWLMIGYLAGIVCFVLGIIRFIQLRKRNEENMEE